MRNRGIWLVIVLALACATPAVGSGFSIYEQSAKASAQAGAWVARADDAAANWYNPAALVRLEGTNFHFGANLIPIGRDTSITTSDPAYGLPTEVKFDAVTNNATPANLYFTHRIDDWMAFGIGVTTPFGLASEWEDRPITFSSKRVDLATFVVNPNLAFKIDDRWSFAVGIDYIYADVKEFSREFDQSSFLELPPGTVVGASDLTGTGDDWGWNLAFQFATEEWKAGLTYRAELSPDIDGEVAFTGVNEYLELYFPDGPGTTTLDLPAQAALGVAYTGFADWEVEFDVSWAQWSRFDHLAIDFENETPAVTDIVLPENWDDTFAFRLGAAWAMAERHELRFGAVFDQGPIPDDTLRPSIPDADRLGISVGYGFHGKSWALDAYVMPLFFQDRDANDGDPLSSPTGVVDGRYESSVNLFGVGFSWRF